MLPIKKIYVDSRFKSGDSASDTDFKIDLPQNLLMPDNTGFYIDDVSVPVSWYTVDANRNNVLFYRVDGAFGYLYIKSGDYSLITLNQAIVDAMNSVYPDSFSANPDVSSNTIGIVGNTTKVFEILTDAQVNALSANSSVSVNKLLRNITPGVHDDNTPYVSGYVDLFPIRNLYLVSSGLGNFNTMSVSGERSIVKKIPVNANYGEMIFDQSVVGMDYLDCSRQTLSRIGFQLKDVFGNVVNLHGNHFSFSIVFSRIREID